MEASTSARLHAWALHEQGKALVRRAVHALGPDVRVMPLKGMLLGALGVVHPAERPLRDVDLLADSLSERELVARLTRAGFCVAEVARAPGYVSLSHPAHGSLWLDLHTRITPIGLGRLSRSYLFEDARPDDDSFGVRVFVPSRVRLVVQLVANALKDHVVHARPQVASDLAALLALCSPVELDAIAVELARVSLRRGACSTLLWAARSAACPAIAALLDRVLHDASERAALEAELDGLQRVRPSLRARVRARARADSSGLWALAMLAAGISLVYWPLRRRWLLAAAKA